MNKKLRPDPITQLVSFSNKFGKGFYNLAAAWEFLSDFVTKTVGSLYPDAQGPLPAALDTNPDFFFSALTIEDQGCIQVTPFT